MRRRFAPLSLLLLGCACASGGSANVERTYVRPGLNGLPLRTIDAFVFVQGPPRAAGESLDVVAMNPPGETSALGGGAADLETTRALAADVRKKLEALGLWVRVFSVPGVAMVAKTPVNTSTVAAVETSTRAMSPRMVGSRDAELEPVDPAMTVAKFRAASQADAVLIVRAVPIDAFTIEHGEGFKTIVGPNGRERIADTRPVRHEGRLLLGQAFLLDRKTGLRLWTKQVPDFPDRGHLALGDPFLDYGLVADADAAPPSADVRATASSSKFSEKMLASFPRASKGTMDNRAHLDSLDLAQEQARQSFLDERHWAIEIGPRWSQGPVSIEARLDGVDLPELDTGALTPRGVATLVPRLTYMAPGGFSFALSVPVGFAPGRFARDIHRDNPNPGGGDSDRNARLTVNGATSYGLELTAGPSYALSDTLTLVPQGGIFGDVLAYDAAPTVILLDTTRARLGIEAVVDLLVRPTPESRIFGRVGGGLRVGIDFGGPPVFAVLLSGGVGLFL